MCLARDSLRAHGAKRTRLGDRAGERDVTSLSLASWSAIGVVASYCETKAILRTMDSTMINNEQ